MKHHPRFERRRQRDHRQQTSWRPPSPSRSAARAVQDFLHQLAVSGGFSHLKYTQVSQGGPWEWQQQSTSGRTSCSQGRRTVGSALGPLTQRCITDCRLEPWVGSWPLPAAGVTRLRDSWLQSSEQVPQDRGGEAKGKGAAGVTPGKESHLHLTPWWRSQVTAAAVQGPQRQSAVHLFATRLSSSICMSSLRAGIDKHSCAGEHAHGGDPGSQAPMRGS